MIEIDLINGSFDREELKELLMDILISKINFHEKKSISSLIVNGSEDEISIKRINELKGEVTNLNQFINNFDTDKNKLKVTSTIKIEII